MRIMMLRRLWQWLFHRHDDEPRRGLVDMGVPPPQGSTATGPPVDYDG